MGLLPGILWIVYAYSNVITDAPPRIGSITATALIYAAMVPAMIIAVVKCRARGVPGSLIYAAFLAWVVTVVLWHWTGSGDASKQVLIYGLSAMSAAQIVLNRTFGTRSFAICLIVASVWLSVWTIGFALTTGFAYRAGVPVNPNLPAALIGSALVWMLAIYLDGQQETVRAWVLGALLVSFYACLLLGSRGVLVALLPACVLVWWRSGATVRRARGLAIGVTAVVALTLMPAVPYAVFRAVVTAAEGVHLSPSNSLVTMSARARSAGTRARLDPRAVGSTALGRFGEEEAGSFNLRWALWVGAVRFVTSGPREALVGGGFGTSQEIAHQANPVFRNVHNAPLELWVDFGLIGLALWLALQWRICSVLWPVRGWPSVAGMSAIVFWAIVGLTATVTDLHVYWITLGVSAAVIGQGRSTAVIS